MQKTKIRAATSPTFFFDFPKKCAGVSAGTACGGENFTWKTRDSMAKHTRDLRKRDEISEVSLEFQRFLELPRFVEFPRFSGNYEATDSDVPWSVHQLARGFLLTVLLLQAGLGFAKMETAEAVKRRTMAQHKSRN